MPKNTNTVASPPNKSAYLDMLNECYNKDNFSGFVSFPHEELASTDLIWEVQIAVLPKRENLYKAAQAITQAVNSGVSFKCWIRSKKGSPLMPDGAQLTKDHVELSDSDPRGKEVCLLIVFDTKTQRFKKTAAECHDMLFRCWQYLLRAKVQFDYAPTKNAIPAAAGIYMPFSIVPPSLHTSRHRINEACDNIAQLPHPLKGLYVTYADLEKYQIPTDSIKAQLDLKIAYLINHWPKRQKLWKNRFLAIAQQSDSAPPVSAVIDKIQTLLETPTPYPENILTDITQQINTLLEISPYCIDNGKTAAPFNEVVALHHQWQDILKNDYTQLNFLKKLLQDCSTKIAGETLLLMGEFITHSYCKEQIGNLKNFPLNNMFLTHPRDMLMLLRNAICLEKERNALQIAENNLTCYLQSCDKKLEALAKREVRRIGMFIYHSPKSSSETTITVNIRPYNLDGTLMPCREINVTPAMVEALRYISAAEAGLRTWASTQTHLQQLPGIPKNKHTVGQPSTKLLYEEHNKPFSIASTKQLPEQRKKRLRLCFG